MINKRTMGNRLEIPKEEDIFGLQIEEMNTDVEIYDIDIYNQNIKPLFEGTNMYKRLSEKSVKT